MSRLPVELYRVIIDCLDAYEDKSTLLACSLTCKAFLHASRYHLFHQVRLTSEYQANLLLNSWTNPCAYVRQFSLYGLRKGNDPQWLNNALPLIVKYLPDVTTLKLTFLVWGSLNDAARSAILSGFRKVEHLEMRSIHFHTPSHVIELIASFPCLINLTCQHVGWPTYRVPLIPLPSSIRSITLAAYQSELFDQLLSLQSHPDLRAIKIRSMEAHRVPDVAKLLKTIGLHLEYLELNSIMSPFQTSDELEHHIDLTHNPNLRSITLNQGAITSSFLDSVFELCSRITSCHIMEQVALGISLDALADLDQVDWPRIDHYFTQGQWANLPKLAVKLQGKVEIESEVIPLIKARLPLLECRGVLNVVVYCDL